MTPKQIKYYETLFNFVRTDYINHPKNFLDFLKFCTDNDFASAVDMWEVLFTLNERDIITSRQLSKAFSMDAFYILYSANEQKAVKAIADNPVITRAVFQYSAEGMDETTKKIFIDFIITNKLAAAEEILKALMKNTSCNKTFGELMKIIIEKMFVEVLKRMGGGKAAITKKQSDLLLTYVNKIKTSEKALLVQRLKELS